MDKQSLCVIAGMINNLAPKEEYLIYLRFQPIKVLKIICMPFKVSIFLISLGQTQNGLILTLKLNLTLNVNDNHAQKTMGILTMVFYTYGPNLLILA